MTAVASPQLVTGYAYDAAGNVQSVTDPMGRVLRRESDALGRRTATIENYVDGTPSADTDRTTRVLYDGSGHLVLLTADLPGSTGDQSTEYLYDVSGGDVNSVDLLAQVIYPNKGERRANRVVEPALDMMCCMAADVSGTSEVPGFAGAPFRTRQAGCERGLACHRAGRLADAEAVYREALIDDPSDARAAHLLGVVAHQQGRPAEALALIRYALSLDGSPADVHNNHGSVLAALGRKAEAEAAFREALARQGDYADAQMNLANALREQGKLDEAERQCRQALERWPSHAELHNALGAVLERQRRVKEALACFSKAAELKPGYVQAEHNRAMALLALGDYERGWKANEWRLRQPTPPFNRSFPTPRWDGSDPKGRTILLHTEGGLGNVIQFSRFATALARKGAEVVLECPPPLVRLLSRLEGVRAVIAMGQPAPRHDCHASLVSLPALLGTTLETLSHEVPYLRPPEPDHAGRVEHYRQLLAADPGLAGSFKVGICWQGNPKFPQDATRSVPLKHFAPLAALPGVRLVSLQVANGREQLATAGFSVTELPAPPEPKDGAFLNAAALMQHLDLVVTSDTSIAHLAGALGVRAWVALSFNACWRWLLERQDSPWYPSLRLFRQPSAGDWEGVFAAIGAEAKKLMS